MKELSIEDIKRVSSDILRAYDLVCQKNNISYSVFYGTLLGAIRHHGFIPWDDDIDVIMTREEYLKFVRVIQEENPFSGEILLFDVERTSDYSLPLVKLVDTHTVLSQHGHVEKIPLGVYIDIFVFDKVPAEKDSRKRVYRMADRMQTFWGHCEMKEVSRTSKGVAARVKHFIKYILNHGFARIVSLAMNRYAMKTNSQNHGSEVFGNLLYCGYRRETDTFPESLINDVIRVDFEGFSVNAVRNYDAVLKQIYGDYMQLPPEEKRVTHHTFDCYWKQ